MKAAKKEYKLYQGNYVAIDEKNEVVKNDWKNKGNL